MTRCQYLTADNRCGIYFNRPKICREYTTDDCEYDGDWSFEKIFETPEQIWEYAEAVLPPRRRPRRSLRAHIAADRRPSRTRNRGSGGLTDCATGNGPAHDRSTNEGDRAHDDGQAIQPLRGGLRGVHPLAPGAVRGHR